MEIEYQLRPADYLVFEYFHHKRGPKPSVGRVGPSSSWMWVVVLCLFVAAFVLEQKGVLPPGFPNHLHVFGMGVLVGTVGMLMLQALSRLAAVKAITKLPDDERAAWLFAPQRVRLTPEGIHFTQEFCSSFIAWRLICFIGVSKNNLFLYETPTVAVIEPRRAVPDHEQFDAFVDLARQYKQGRSPAEWPQPTGITTGTPASPTDTFRPDTPEPTP
jgi:hypothetical protein